MGLGSGLELVAEGVPLHQRPGSLVHRGQERGELIVLSPGAEGKGGQEGGGRRWARGAAAGRKGGGGSRLSRRRHRASATPATMVR